MKKDSIRSPFFVAKLKAALIICPSFTGQLVKEEHIIGQAFYVCISNPRSDGTGATTVIASV